MGEPSCLLRDCSHQPGQNHAAALGGSISFGRFLTESLDWGKWSSFSHNRYLEEAEKFSVPGSVAQRKAYFEAHYKKLAARKAVSLVEQANATTKDSPERHTEEVSDAQVESGKSSNSTVDGEVEEADKEDYSSRTSLESCNGSNEAEIAEVEKPNVIKEDETHIEPSLQLEAIGTGTVEDAENQNKLSEFELSKKCTLEKQPLKESCVINMDIADCFQRKDSEDSAEKKTKVIMSNSSVLHRSAALPPSPASSLRCPEENTSTPCSNSKDKKKSVLTISKSLHTSISIAQFKSGMTTPKTKSSLGHGKIKETKATAKSPKPCHFKTPTKVSPNGVPKLKSIVVQSEKKRIAANSNYIGIRACREPMATALFCHATRADERTEIKKKRSAESELRKLRQSLCFKARPLPEFYHNAKPIENEKTEKSAESELSKLQQSHCFKARPLPEFYRNTEPTKSGMKKIPKAQPHLPSLQG